MAHKELTIGVLADESTQLPSYGTHEAAGADLRADLPGPLTLAAGASCLVPTGLRLEIPKGYEVQIRPRSGLALNHQLTVLNSPGTIDSDYRGEVKIILINHGTQPFVIEPGMRIAQMVVAPVVHAKFVRLQELAETARSSGGFGHSGLQ